MNDKGRLESMQNNIKLIEMKCRMCGALLSIEQNAALIKCPYCHCEYLLQEAAPGMLGTRRNYGDFRFTYDGENYFGEAMQ